MHRPLLFIVLAFSLGIFLDYSVQIPFLLLLGLTTGVLVFCWSVLFVWRSGLFYIATCLMLAFWAGASYHHVRFHSCPADHVVNLVTEDKRLMRLRGVIVDMPVKRQVPPPPLPWQKAKINRSNTRFPLRVEEVEGDTGWHRVGGVVLVNIYGTELPQYRYGQRVEVLGNVFIPYGSRNPGQFDYRRYLQRQRTSIRVVASVENANNVRLIEEGCGNIFFRGVYGLKERLAEVIRSSALPGSVTTLAGLALGTREEIPWEVIENFKRTGTLHFLAISGLHVGILVLSIYPLLLLLGVPKRIAVLLIIVLTSLYALLTGLKPPVLRATLMVIFIFGAYLVRRQWDFGSGIAAAVMSILIWNPSDLFNVGFQLSVSGVLGIVYLSPRIESFFWGDSLLVERLQVEEEYPQLYHRLWPYLRASLCISLGAWIATSPLILYYFHRVVPLGAPLSVIIFPLIWTITVCGFVLLPVGLFSPLLASPVAYVAHGADIATKAIISIASSIPGCSFYSPAPSWPWLVGLYALAMPFMLRGVTRLRFGYIACLCLLVGNIYLYGHIIAGVLSRGDSALWLTGLDVGHGSCTLIQFPNGKNILYDTGRRGWSDVGKRVIAPFLWHMGIRTIDAVVISHEDTDHYNGLPSLIERFRVRKVLVNEQLFNSPRARGLLGFLAVKDVPVEVIEKGAELEGLGGAGVRVLHPPGGTSRLSHNDTSSVLMIEYGGKGVLLCGDIEKRGIETLLDSGYDLRADVVQAPHHGAFISNVADLYTAARPRYILVSAGSTRDLSAQRPEGGLVLQTREMGALFLKVDKTGIKAWTYKGGEVVDD
ncbi:MAG: DNA internalization-related competence protein ComEC/Rec2 [Candidatus Brocadiales bacterium]